MGNKFNELEEKINRAEEKILHKDEKNLKNKYKFKYSFANVSYDLAGITLGSVLLGLFLDHYFETAPWFLISFVFLGTLSGLLLLWKRQQEKE